MQYMAWYARCDMQYICRLPKEKIDQGLKLTNQVCRWKDELISVEIDIKITGNGCTVCKWQASQEWRKTAINSMMPLSMQQETKLLHSNITTKHIQWCTQDSWQNMNTELRLNHTRAGTNKHGKVQKISASQTWWKYWTWLKQHQVAMFRASYQHATGTYNSKTRHGMILLKA